MSIKLVISEEEIKQRPNYYELGEFITNKYWQTRRDLEGPKMDDEHFSMEIADDGTVKRIVRAWTCSVCGESTHEVDSEYLIGYDHLQCKLKEEMNVEYDKCVICGKTSPYTRLTHIDHRVGYVEGCGQTCFSPNQCER
jgi:hypothetical protein